MQVMVLAILDEFLLKYWIGKMSAVPSQKIGDAVQNGECEMCGICLGLWRDLQELDEALG